jgi:signal transduction histidine kinase
MTVSLRQWLNSMQAHMIGFALAVTMVLTGISVVVVLIAGPPQRSPMTVYDISRVVLGVPPAQTRLPREFTHSKSKHPPLPTTQVERQLSSILAHDLGLPADHVRLTLGDRGRDYFTYLERQAALYARDGQGSPIIYGTVAAAVLQPDGSWDMHVRRSKSGYANVWNILKASPWLGFLVLIPLSMWFGTRIARPVQALAQAASQVGDGREYRVPEAGPTEIRVAAKALNEMQGRIQAFVRERTALVGAIAHDLRTPLNSLRFRIARAPDEVRLPAEGDIKQLDRLIASILEYAESEGRPPSVEAIDLSSLLQSMVDDLHDQGVDVEFQSSPVKVEGDLLMLRRLFANLVGNAVKFADRVSISLTSTAAQAIVVIADNGPGMSPSDLAQAFEPFFRGEPSRNRTTGGMGLGLAIAKAVVEAHAGRIELSNSDGGGLQAVVVLPLGQNV